ncbi:MAG: transporter substrate-binding protein [Xanthobacteraceae bacterium]|jgi:NitT/TauT family transport system substrate-binding protein|nr:transporter substrate-binding protein [Xanthobacteraceae bacterium]
MKLLNLLLGAAALLAAGDVTANAQTAVKFSLDWKFEGTQAPFLVALDKGYFKAEGLDVTVDTSGGSVEPINRVASGTYDMAFADINSMVKFRDQNPAIPLKAVYMVYNNPPFAIVGRKSKGISDPKSLEGKKLGAPAPDGAYAQWPIFTAANGIDASKVTVMNVGFPVREPMLVAGDVDAITGFSFSSYINVKYSGIPQDDIVVLLMSNYGLKLYGNAILVNPKFASEKPEVVKAFLRAFNKALKDTAKDPADAITSVLKRNEVAKKDVELDRLQIALRDNIITSEVKANGLGGVDMGRLAQAIDQIGLTYQFKGEKPKPVDVFDSSFLPSAADRKIQ